MAICGSIITNLIGTTSAVIVGGAVLSVLPEFIVVGLTKYASSAILEPPSEILQLNIQRSRCLHWQSRLS